MLNGARLHCSRAPSDEHVLLDLADGLVAAVDWILKMKNFAPATSPLAVNLTGVPKIVVFRVTLDRSFRTSARVIFLSLHAVWIADA